MEMIILVMIFILGTILGSGLNAWTYRLETGTSWTHGRSCCPHCNHQLSWWELLPLVSFALLRRRCHECGQKISWQYPLVELAAGGLLLLSYFTFGLTLQTFLVAATSIILLFIYVYDGRTMLIPNPAVWAFNTLAFVALFLHLDYNLITGGSFSVLPDLWSLASGPLVAAPLFLIWLLSHGRAMGFGDVKLTLGIGWMLGIAGGLSALTYAFWIGAVISIGLLAHERMWKSSSRKDGEEHTIKSADSTAKLTMKSAVPFGPFLILGWLVVLFSGITLF
jgi:prepilin signal peptidase PulO-like enzyme (type II secretory pathway)